MSNTRKALFLVAVFLAKVAQGQEVLTLDQIITEISQNNPSLKAYESLIKSEEAKVEGAGAWTAPMVGGGTFMTPYPGSKVIDESDRGAWILSAEQDIPNPAKTKAKKEYLKTRSETYLHGRNERLNELRTKARQLYFDLLISYKKLRFQKEGLGIIKTMRKLAELRYPYNQGTLGQIFKTEGRTFEADNMLEMTLAEIRSAKIDLNTLMHRSPTLDLEVDTATLVSFDPIANIDTAYFAENRSDIRHMEHDIYSMKLNINQMRQEAKPDFKIRFEHMSTRAAMMPNQYTLMGMVSIPIAPWSSKMYKSEVKSMSLEREAMQEQKEGMLSQMLGMTKSMENELITMQKQLSNYESKILPALNKNLKVSMISYQENKADLNTVIDGWEAVNMAQMNYIGQLQNFYQMIVEYEKNIER